MTSKIGYLLALAFIAIPVAVGAQIINRVQPVKNIVPLTATSTESDLGNTNSGSINSGNLVPLAPGTINGINPQPEPPETQIIDPDPPTSNDSSLGNKIVDPEQPSKPLSAKAIIDPQPPGQAFSLIKKCVVASRKSIAEIDDEVTWSSCGQQYADLGANVVISAIKKCVVDGLKNGATQIDDEVTWNKCAENSSELSPQPDPPGKFSLDPINQLNPQPEPPLPGVNFSKLLSSASGAAGGEGQQVRSLEGFNVKTEQSDNGWVLKFQPTVAETPLGLDEANSYKFLIAGKKIEVGTSTLDFTESNNQVPILQLKLRNSSSSAATLIKLKMINDNAVMNFPKGQGEGQVTIKADFEVQEGKLVLINGDQKLPLPQSPDSFYNGLEKALDAKKGLVKDVNLGVENDKPVYQVKTETKAKLFGLIPIGLASTVSIDAESNSVQRVKNPWYAFLATKPDLSQLKLVPDFAITNIELIPNSYKEGDKMSGKITVTNVGTAFGVTYYNIATGGCTTISYYWGDSQYKWSCILAALAPGESVVFDQNFTGYCQPFKVVFDKGQTVKDDPDFGNNTMTVSGNCTQ